MVCGDGTLVPVEEILRVDIRLEAHQHTAVPRNVRFQLEDIGFRSPIFGREAEALLPVLQERGLTFDEPCILLSFCLLESRMFLAAIFLPS
jgi:hypothetical protein